MDSLTNLDSLVRNNGRKAPGRKPGESIPYWSEEEIKTLKKLTKQGVSFDGIAIHLNRTPNAVYQKICKLRLPHKNLIRIRKKRFDKNLTTVNLRVDRDFAIRLSLFAADYGYSRSGIIEDVMTNFMNQVESSESKDEV